MVALEYLAARQSFLNDKSATLLSEKQLGGLASDLDKRGIIIVSGKGAELKVQDGLLDKLQPRLDGLFNNSFAQLAEVFPQAADTTLGNEQFDGMLNQIVDLNKDIEGLLGDYQKAVNGELLDANGNKVDPFVIQMKLQQAMQQRLEISTLLSNLLKMVHDGIQGLNRNIG